MRNPETFTHFLNKLETMSLLVLESIYSQSNILLKISSILKYFRPFRVKFKNQTSVDKGFYQVFKW